MNITAILQAHGFSPKVPIRISEAGTAQAIVANHVPVVPDVPAGINRGAMQAEDMRRHLLMLAGRCGFDATPVPRLHDLDLIACAGLDDAQLVTYLELLGDTATRWAGKVPLGHTAPIHCHHCGPVWVHPSMAACLPVVDGWPRALGCPWCAIRKAGGYVPRPPAQCLP